MFHEPSSLGPAGLENVFSKFYKTKHNLFYNLIHGVSHMTLQPYRNLYTMPSIHKTKNGLLSTISGLNIQKIEHIKKLKWKSYYYKICWPGITAYK